MTTNKTIFDLPRDILSKIYQFDSTYKKVFSMVDFKSDIQHAAKRVTMINFIKRSVISRTKITGETQWMYKTALTEDTSIGPEYKIHLHPTGYLHTKYSVIRKATDPRTLDIKHFHGYVCDTYLGSLDKNFRIIDDKEKVFMQYIALDKENRLSLFKVDRTINYRKRMYRINDNDYC